MLGSDPDSFKNKWGCSLVVGIVVVVVWVVVVVSAAVVGEEELEASLAACNEKHGGG